MSLLPIGNTHHIDPWDDIFYLQSMYQSRGRLQKDLSNVVHDINRYRRIGF